VRVIVAALGFLVPLAAQVHFGIKGGIGFTNIAEASSAPRVSARNLTARWTVGPVVEVDLPANLGLEVNGLYRPVAYEWAFLFRTPVQPPPPLVFIKESSKVWDFPALLKHRFPGGTARLRYLTRVSIHPLAWRPRVSGLQNGAKPVGVPGRDHVVGRYTREFPTAWPSELFF
jgi:hypothetical protein